MIVESGVNYEFLCGSDSAVSILYGGRGCFLYDQKIKTNNGVKYISIIKDGDIVESYNETTGSIEYKKVINTFEYDSSNYIEIELKNGSVIKCTPNHKFLHNGDWIPISQLLKKYGYDNMEGDTEVQQLPCDK